MELFNGKIDQTYKVVEIKTNDGEVIEFLFSLGCFPGEQLTIISKLASNFVISVKDARYSIDGELAKVIIVEE